MRRTWLDTEDWQSNYNGNKKAQHKRDQYSFEGDGPVVIPHLINGRNKLFFLASYEEMKDILPNPSYNTYSIPNPAWLTGDFSTATYWNSTTQSLQPLTIYDPLTPLTYRRRSNRWKDEASARGIRRATRFPPAGSIP